MKETKKKKEKPTTDTMIRQQANYNEHDQASPINDPFFETKSNPLSSKGNWPCRPLGRLHFFFHSHNVHGIVIEKTAKKRYDIQYAILGVLCP